MQLKLPKDAALNPLTVMRKAGYSPFVDPVTREESYVLRLSTGFYPRFHAYVISADTAVIFDVHLDQKQPSYGQNHAHNGEYDGPTIEREVSRIASWARAAIRETTHPTHSDEEESPKKPPTSGGKWFDWFRK